MLPASTVLPRKVFDGFGYASCSVSVFTEPKNGEELAASFRYAREHGLTIAMRGSGRSTMMVSNSMAAFPFIVIRPCCYLGK